VRPVISYGPSYGALEPRYSEPRYCDDPEVDDIRRDDMLRRRERDVEDYINDGRLDGRPEGRRASDFIDRRESFYDLRTIGWTNRHPFPPTPLPRRYPQEDSDSGW